MLTPYQKAVPMVPVPLTDTAHDTAQCGQISPVLLNCYFKFPAFQVLVQIQTGKGHSVDMTKHF